MRERSGKTAFATPRKAFKRTNKTTYQATHLKKENTVFLGEKRKERTYSYSN